MIIGKVLRILSFFLLLLSACGKEMNDSSCSHIGQILNYDNTECGCCPGWLIKVDNDTIKVLNLPNENQIRRMVNFHGFPISVKFNYEDIYGSCEDFYKKVTCIEII